MAESCLPAGRGLKRHGVYMFYVYFLKSTKDNGLYIGKTNNLKRRLYEHNLGKVQSTKSRKPLIILGYECCENQEMATKLEKEWKKGYKREELKIKYNLSN